jgi:hypothetical protein
MNTYRVYFRSDLQWGREDIDAETPAQALAIARQRADDITSLCLDYYEPFDNPINEIEICDDDHDDLAVWQDDDLRLRLAARDLLGALQQAVTALNIAPRFKVPSLDTDSYAIAAVCDRAIRHSDERGCRMNAHNPPFRIPAALFELGRIVATPGALQACSCDHLSACLSRHVRGDWGVISAEDRKSNFEALFAGERILSAYPIDPAKPCLGFGNNTLWIITEADRSVTTFLLPDEY